MKTFFVYNQSKEKLQDTLIRILSSEAGQDFEIIYIDNATKDGAWDLANQFAEKFPRRMTISRSKDVLDAQALEQFALHLASGDGDEIIQFNSKKKQYSQYFKKNKNFELPLVSITVHNYNYGEYLEKCLTSIFEQTYPNIEVVLSDNASSDNSWEIAGKFAKTFPNKISLIRNRDNFGPYKNIQNCLLLIRGDLRIELCSDDYLRPDCVGKCVEAFRQHPEIGFVMFHRDIVDENGAVTKEAPFYNGSFLIDGTEQAAVYMMAAVNPSISQICYDTSVRLRMNAEPPMSRWWGARITDFKFCLQYPIAYISEPLLGHRVHSASDSKSTEANLLEIIGPYLLNFYFVDLAKGVLGEKNEVVSRRLGESIKKMATLSLRYASRALIRGETILAGRYFYLTRALDETTVEDSAFKLLDRYFNGTSALEDVLSELRSIPQHVARTTSYPPPPGSQPLQLSVLRGPA